MQEEKTQTLAKSEGKRNVVKKTTPTENRSDRKDTIKENKLTEKKLLVERKEIFY